LNLALSVKVASVVAALSLAVLAAGCGGSHGVTLPKRCTLRMGGLGQLAPYYEGTGLLAELRDGSIVVGAAHTHHSKLEIVLRRVGSDCRVVSSFGSNGTATITVENARDGMIEAMAAAPDNRLLLAGTDGPHELVGRLLANGSVDRAFGTDGWTRFRPKLKNPFPGMPSERLATSIALGPAGTIFLGGDDYTAHCCTTDYVSELSAAGALVRRFGGGGTVVVPKISGSYITEVAANADGSVYAFVEYLGSGCGYPALVRMRKDGSLDSGFASRMKRTLKRVAPTSYTFTPTLVGGSDGKFVLVGSSDETCPVFVPHPHNVGLAVGVLPSGRLDRVFGKSGVTRVKRFLTEEYESPPALRLPSGEIVIASFVYSSSGRLRGDVVARSSAKGSFAGSRLIAKAKLPRRSRVLGLLPAPNATVWLVVGSREEIELIPVR
jgi:hypothetical protein